MVLPPSAFAETLFLLIIGNACIRGEMDKTEWTTIQTGLGILPVAVGMARQMHMLSHREPLEAVKAPLDPGVAPTHHPAEEKGSEVALMKQWERLLRWATWKTLTDFKVMPARPARATAHRLAQQMMRDYGPGLSKWLAGR